MDGGTRPRMQGCLEPLWSVWAWGGPLGIAAPSPGPHSPLPCAYPALLLASHHHSQASDLPPRAPVGMLVLALIFGREQSLSWGGN